MLDGTGPASKIVSNVFLFYGVGDLCRVAKKVEISAKSSLPACIACNISAKGVVIEVIVGLLKLVAEAIVGVFEIDTSGVKWSAKGAMSVVLDTAYTSSSLF